MILYDYFRSTASYRVRITLALKGIDHQSVPIHLVNNGGEQHSEAYRDINPQSLVPTLVSDEGPITQSLAIIDYLENICPTPSIYPDDNYQRAQVASIAGTIASDIHPLNNLRVLQYLTGEMGLSDKQKSVWYQHWIAEGFSAIEALLEPSGGEYGFCFGSHITLADICLIPQVYNAHRFNVPMSSYPIISKINEHCLGLEPFATSQPVAPQD